jgi:hypothetical protein
MQDFRNPNHLPQKDTEPTKEGRHSLFSFCDLCNLLWQKNPRLRGRRLKELRIAD